MNYTALILALSVGLFVGMLALLESGRRLGRRRLDADPEGARSGVSAAEGAVFGLLGLLIAFSFSGAAGRFQTRRELITDESNDIGTAWLRLDLLPPDAQPSARDCMRRYVDARLALYQGSTDGAAVSAAVDRVSTQQAALWRVAVAARGNSEPAWGVLVFPALNDMFDIGSKRVQALQWHPPTIVFVLLYVLALGCAWLAGVAMAGASRRPTIHMIAFAAVVALTVYLILDLEYPRQGLLRIDGDDQVLVDLRSGMG